MQKTATPAHLLTRREVAVYLSISQRKLDALTASGEIPRIKIGSSVRFLPDDLNAFIGSRKG